MSKDEKEKELLDRIFDLEAQIKKLKDRKRYGLVWEEKVENFETESKNALPILREKGGKFPDIITDQKQDFNILIEGDNFHALSVLAYTHQNKVDVIYIDPPYNTGKKDFVYNDHFVDIEDRFRHSKWLSFMAKRLRLAKQVLSDNGVIYISINDYEVSQLKILCDFIFNEENFIAKLVWENKEGGGSSDSLFFRIKHEYVLVYAKNKNKLILEGEYKEEDESYGFQDKYIAERGRYKLIKLNSFSIQYSKSLDYEIEIPNGNKIFPSENGKRGCWRWSQKKFEWGIKNDFIEFKKNQDGNLWVYTKQYFKVDENNKPTVRKNPYRGVISKWSSTLATKQLEKIFNSKKFNYPKPYELLSFLLGLFPKKDSSVLDFFAGSGTTGHAVLDLNKKDGGKRKFILCTNNENKICEDITYERIKRVSLGYENPKGEKVAGLGGNLKYLKTDFVPLEKSADSLKQKIVEGSTEIICLKENAFDLVCDNYAKTKSKIFQNQHKFVAILFDLFYFEEFVSELKKLKEKPVAVYVFSYTKDFSKEEFGDLKIDFSVEPIPEKILETYKKIFKF
jgi:adenine-specific DNA-methyltransferase